MENITQPTMNTLSNRKRNILSGLILFIGVLVGITVLAYAFGFAPWSAKASLGNPQITTGIDVTDNSKFNPFNIIERIKDERSKASA